MTHETCISFVQTHPTGSDAVQDLVQTSVVLLDGGSVNQDIVNFDDDSRDSFQYFCETALKDFRAGIETEWNPVHHVPTERSNEARQVPVLGMQRQLPEGHRAVECTEDCRACHLCGDFINCRHDELFSHETVVEFLVVYTNPDFSVWL